MRLRDNAEKCLRLESVFLPFFLIYYFVFFLADPERAISTRVSANTGRAVEIQGADNELSLRLQPRPKVRTDQMHNIIGNARTDLGLVMLGVGGGGGGGMYRLKHLAWSMMRGCISLKSEKWRFNAIIFEPSDAKTDVMGKNHICVSGTI